MVDDGLVIEPDAHAAADHNDAEAVPLPDGAVGAYEGVAAGRSFGVVPETARAFRGAVAFGVGHGGIPNLNLGHAA